MVLLLVGVVAGVLNREVLDPDRFAAHVDAVRTDADVARQVGALLTARLIDEQPDLVAIRPLIEATATGVVASSLLGPVVRGSLAPLYEALVLGEDDPVVLRLADVAAVVVAAVTVLAPDMAVSVPADLDVRLSDIGAGVHSSSVIRPVHLVQVLSWLAPLLALAVLVGAALLAGTGEFVPTVLIDVGRAVLGAALLLATLLVITSVVVDRSDAQTLAGAVRVSVWDQLSGPFWITAGGMVATGLVLALLGHPSTGPARTLLHAGVLIMIGLTVMVDPSRAAAALLWLAGAGLLVSGMVIGVVGLTRAPAARTWTCVAVGVLLTGVVVGAWPGDHQLDAATGVAPRQGCNGHAELCSRRYDQVAFPATHNSMAAASEPGWFFPEQPNGITEQLDAGVRVLLIDSWYGRETNRPRVIATVGEARDRAVAEANAAFGPSAVTSALRLQKAIGLTPRGPTAAYLCHGLCEVGATSWRASLEALRAWLDAHPREVVTLFVQDEVSPADTAALIEQTGLLRDVYRPAAGKRWPTLGQMIESGKRLVVLMENHGGGAAYPWLLQGFDLVQDTPFLFRTADALVNGKDTCGLNRGHSHAPLFLINHWVTDKSAEVTNAARVNTRDVLGVRVAACQEQRGQLPNFVAVDFYDRGDLFGVVDELNGVR